MIFGTTTLFPEEHGTVHSRSRRETMAAIVIASNVLKAVVRRGFLTATASLIVYCLHANSFAHDSPADATLNHEHGIKFAFPKDFIANIPFEEVQDSTEYFFTCTEHPDYLPFGKPFGPYDSEANCERAMARHSRATGHSDMVMWTGPSLIEDAKLKNAAEQSGRCFCVGDCVKGSGDSSHFRKTVDVGCELSVEEKKKQLMAAMVQHYLEAGHVTDISDLDRVFADMRQNIRIRCISVGVNRIVDANKDLKDVEIESAETGPDNEKAKGLSRGSAFKKERVQVYAGPNVFGPWHVVASHIGSVSYDIKVEPVGDTVVVGEVRYYNEQNRQITSGFYRETSINTGNSIANIEVRLKGVPFGSSCWVTVE